MLPSSPREIWSAQRNTTRVRCLQNLATGRSCLNTRSSSGSSTTTARGRPATSNKQFKQHLRTGTRPPPPLPLPSPPFCTSIIPGWWVADPAPPPLSGSHVLASYAGFLWEAEEDDDEGDATQSEDYFAGAQVPFGALASAAHPRPLPC